MEIGDATNNRFIESITKKYGIFDIILDDGLHINRDVIKSFEVLFPLLNDNGIYIIEDTICYKSEKHLVQNFKNQERASRPRQLHHHLRRGEVRHGLHIRVLALVTVAIAIVVLGSVGGLMFVASLRSLRSGPGSSKGHRKVKKSSIWTQKSSRYMKSFY